MTVLITTLHTPCDPRRANEYIACLHANLAHPYIDVVKVLLETQCDSDYGFLGDIKHEKLEIIPINKRPFFSDLFALANHCKSGEVAVICNGDIYFDKDSHLERACEVDTHQFWTISRYDEQDGGNWILQHYAAEGSHDCWIFRTPIPPFQADYHLGILGCDAILAQRAVEASLTISNPCLSIRPRHLHRTSVRNNTLAQKRRTYWQDNDYMKLGARLYCAPPSTIESPVTRSRRSLRYILMSVVGHWFLPIYRSYRSTFVQEQLTSIK